MTTDIVHVHSCIFFSHLHGLIVELEGMWRSLYQSEDWIYGMLYRATDFPFQKSENSVSKILNSVSGWKIPFQTEKNLFRAIQSQKKFV